MKNRKTNWQKIRKFFQDVHLWIGLASGLILILVCFSGTIYVFNTEFTEMAASHLYKVKDFEGKTPLPVQQLAEAVSATAGGPVTSIVIPENKSRTYQFYVKKENDKSRSGTGYFVNPYTGNIAGTSQEQNGMQEFMRTMFSLHRWLLLDKVETPVFKSITNQELGRKITGTATILFTIGCITGLIIWFPNRVRNWKQGLKIKFAGNWKRTNHDLHNSLAFYSLFFLLVMGITGPQWSFEWYREGMQKSLATYKPKDGGSKKEQSGKKILQQPVNTAAFLPIDRWIEIAENELTYVGDYRVTMPSTNEETVQITKNKTGFFAPAAGDKLTLLVSTGAVTKSEIFKEKPLNERIAGSIKALHVGTVYGMFTKIIYFITCLIATSLPITGTIIWLNKLKKRKSKRRKEGIIQKNRMPAPTI